MGSHDGIKYHSGVRFQGYCILQVPPKALIFSSQRFPPLNPSKMSGSTIHDPKDKQLALDFAYMVQTFKSYPNIKRL